MFKSLPDPLWHASVLEGLATVPILEAWVSGSGLVIQYFLLVSSFS
jgi:trafficking protein particle complex subunit 9